MYHEVKDSLLYRPCRGHSRRLEAQNQNVAGWVLLRFTVTDQGAVLDPVVEDSDPPGVFDESAIRAIREFQYEPYSPEEATFERLNVFHLFKFRPSS